MFIVTSDSNQLQYKSFVFSGGEVSVKLTPEVNNFLTFSNRFVIKAILTSSNSIMELLLLVDAIRRSYPGADLSLICPYVPYARQDRPCAPGESLSLKVFCDLINSLNFTDVIVSDVHSDVALALLNNVKNIGQEEFVKKIPANVLQNTILVSPDGGALKKIHKVAKAVQLPIVRADKVRDVNTGAITETIVYSGNVGDANFLIVDDIADGAASFLHLSKVLRPLTSGKLFLYVTHGIFSKGFEELLKHFDAIYVAHMFPNVVRPIGKVFTLEN